ncbi:hypothetical protein LCGC14_0145280 [marine sediment metagenome]|uniref:Uncharacterized protein n=1 Tax=marine sediment metagenome TaxID=412755 RepID=A0A0F9V383_9ZZZZ
MTDEQKAAYVVAASVEAFAEIQGMITTNKEREADGKALAYDEEAFSKIAYKHGIDNNSMIILFHGH